MILEGLVTTLNADGSVNLSPMGPRLDAGFDRFTLRPYQTSTTYKNLQRQGAGVLHVTDDVLLLAKAAIGQLELPPVVEIPDFRVPRLADACRWYAFTVESIDAGQERTTLACRSIASGRVRDFLGFNRAKHAVVEAAILATRVGILPREEILTEFASLTVLVEKTAGDQERRAFALLDDYVHAR